MHQRADEVDLRIVVDLDLREQANLLGRETKGYVSGSISR